MVATPPPMPPTVMQEEGRMGWTLVLLWVFLTSEFMGSSLSPVLAITMYSTSNSLALENLTRIEEISANNQQLIITVLLQRLPKS